MTRSSLLAVLLGALLSVRTGAQDPPRPTAEEFIKRWDKNKDGVLTKDELPPQLAAVFERFDKNKDGKLDRDEVAAMLEVVRRNGQGAAQPEALVRRWLDRLDTNKDGKISKKEAEGTPLATAFDQFDTNKDGFLDREELMRAAARFIASRDRPEPGRATLEFDDLDRNADGRLTREELKGTPLYEKFDEIDTNKDGKIDPKEFAAYMEKIEKAKKER
jgi:Ca2+-binding EF-hand superfamily protein